MYSVLCWCTFYVTLFLYLFFFLMIRRPPRSTLDRSSAASDVYKRQGFSFFNKRKVVDVLSFKEGKPIFGAPVFVQEDSLGNQTVRNRLVKEFSAEASFKSVSYTHLRAHETVLDLVCRLLLEKKKKQTHRII